MAVPYVFQSATQPLPLAQLDVNFNTPITVGSTDVQLGDTIDTLVGMVEITSVEFVGHLTGNVTGDLTGNADTVTDGAYLSAANVFTGINNFSLNLNLAQGVDLIGYEPTVLFFGKTVDGTSPILDGDVAGSITFTGLTSGGPGTAARIFTTVDGTVGVGAVPASLSFATTDAGGILNTHQVINPNGTTNFIGGASTPSVAVTQVASAITVDCSLSNVFETTLTASIVSVTFTNAFDGQTINWFITQDATGSRTMGWDGTIKFPGGAVSGLLSTAPDAVDLVVLSYRDTTGFWYGSVLQDFSSNAPLPPPAESYFVTYDLALSNTVNVEFVGTTAASINWGDGTIEAFAVAGVASHTYAAVSGTVSVAIYGTCDELTLLDGFTAVTSWDVGLTPIVSLSSADLVSVPDFLPADITRIRFPNCTTFNDVNVTTWDTSAVTNMQAMFAGCTVFNQNISVWDTGAVTNMSGMFIQGAIAFNQPIGIWDTALVQSMAYMFSGATAFNGNIGAWDTGNVTSMNNMFENATAFNQNISTWDTLTCSLMNSMFEGAIAFNQPIGTWNTSAVNNMVSMFSGATAFNGNIGAWNTSIVANMGAMFAFCSSFNQNISAWDTGAVENMANMFKDAAAFNQPIGTWDVSTVQIMIGMFDGALAFNANIGAWVITAVTNIQGMFAGATSFNQDISGWSTGTLTDLTAMFSGATAFNQPLNAWNTSSVNNMTAMFAGASAFNQPIDTWDTSLVASMGAMFSGATVFDQDLSTWCVTLIPSEPGGFNSGGVLTPAYFPVWGTCPPPAEAYLVTYDLAISNTVDVEFISTANATINWGDGNIETVLVAGTTSHTYVAVSGTVSVAIYGTCGGLTLLNGFTAVTSWGVGLTSIVTLTSSDLVSVPAFLPADVVNISLTGCNNFNSAAVITWDTSNVTQFANTFAFCSSFNQNIGAWDTGAAINMNNMFQGAAAFNQDISLWDTAFVINMNAMFDSATIFDQDISTWVVTLIPTLPTDFNTGGVLTPAYFPVWGV